MKKVTFLLAMIALLLFVSPAFAQVETQQDGTKIGGAAVTLNFVGPTVTGVGRLKTITTGSTIEVLSSTTDTLATTDSPRTIICTANGDNKITLPTAATGLEFTIVDGNIALAGATNRTERIFIDPQSTDTIMYSPAGAAGLDANDRLESSGNTGDSITLRGASTVWYVTGMGEKAWVDGGASD